jgi:IrrE N-terminal-like domain
MTAVFGPERWAIKITKLLNLVLGPEHFPVDVVRVAREYTAQRFPGDAITMAEGANLPGFDGALCPAPPGKTGWGIVYNNALTSPGRINFTLAHEFGHYLLHRLAYPNGIRCGEQDIVRWDSSYGQIEHQANRFAANLLMPLDDFRRQIDARATVDLDLISGCAERYRVSLIAAILRWLTYTSRRAVLVVSRDDFILWSRSSDAALKTGAFFRTSGAPVEIPAASLAATQDQLADGRTGVLHVPGVWFGEAVREMTIFSEQYDFTITLLLLEDRDRYVQLEPDPEEDTYDRFMRRQ